MTIYSGFSHEKWWFSIATLNYQRVSLPSTIHQISTQCAVCDQHSVLLSKSAMVEANCFIPGKKRFLLKEHAACRLNSALMIFPQVRSSIPAEPYNMWKNAIQPLMKLSLPIVFLVWPFLQERLHFFKSIALKTRSSLK